MTAHAPATPTRRARLLLLDDDAVVRRLLQAALRCRGLEVEAAADGASGVALLLDTLLELDALVVDLDLPGRDGWSFLRLIRGAGGERDLPVVVLARSASAAVRAQLRALGADAVLDPCTGPAALAAAVEAAIAPARGGRVRAAVAGAATALAGLLVPVAAEPV